jgi:ABC-type glycerol-3-phosphate transport system substrate-binding protein
MSLRRWARLAGALAVTLGGCLPAVTPEPTATPTAPPIVPATMAAATATPSPTVLTVWLPPFLAPDPSTSAGSMLQARLDDFELRHAGIKIDVRIKQPSGAAGLLETLRAAEVVARPAVPDLISLNPDDLAAGAEEKLIVPYPGNLPPPDATEWYSFALDPTLIGEVPFGIPSGSQGDILAYRTTLYARPPADWSSLLGGSAAFLFPAGDPSARFTIAQYLALDGALTQEDGKTAIDPATLETVLTFYGSAYNAGVLPLTTRQRETSAATWQVFREGRSASAVAPLSAWMAEPTDSAAVPLPTRSGDGVCLTTTWSWAVVTRDPQRQTLTVELVEWLTDPFFLGPWTNALGVLPPNSAALDAWPDGPQATLANRLVHIARPVPAAATLETVGPVVRDAVDSVLSGELAPQEAALQASTKIGGP